jgi:hypothetical protein
MQSSAAFQSFRGLATVIVLTLTCIAAAFLQGLGGPGSGPAPAPAEPRTVDTQPSEFLLASARLAKGIGHFAVDEKAGLLALTTRETLSVCTYPGLGILDTVRMQDPELLGFVEGGEGGIVVCSDWRSEIRILSSTDLHTAGRIDGTFNRAVTNRESSLIAVTSSEGTLRTARFVDGKLLLSEPKPFPHAKTISTMAALTDGSLLYATTDRDFFYTSPPYNTSVRISTQPKAISSIQIDEAMDCFTTEELGAFRVWRLSTRRPMIALFAYAVRDGELRRLDIEQGAGDADPKLARPHAEISDIRGAYCAAKSLFACTDPWPKTGRLLVASLTPFSLSWKVDSVAQMLSRVHLSADGSLLITINGRVNCWDLTSALAKQPNGVGR